ncbi:MAG: ComEC/Rec2 family competence protein [Pseudomonadota bacterium]
MADKTQTNLRERTYGRTNDQLSAQVDERLAFNKLPVKPSTGHTVEPLLTQAITPKRFEPAPKRLLLQDTAITIRSRLMLALADEVEYGTLFLTIPIFMILGCATYFALSVEPARHQIPALLVANCVAACALRSYLVPRLLLVASAFLLLGALTAQTHTHWRSTPTMGSAVVTTVTGRVMDVERRPDGAARYTVKIFKTERPRLRHAPEIVRITSRKENPNLVPGTIMRATAQLRAASGPVRQGGYDFAFQAYFAGYGANGFSYGMPEAITHSPDVLFGGLSGMRLRLADHIVKQAPEKPASAVAAALIAGKKSRIPGEVTEVLRRTGLAHILAISGLHMALVAGTVMFCVRLALSWDQTIAARRQTKKWAAGAALCVASVYLLLAGASVATQRSFIMLTVMLLALCADRPALTKRNLAIAAIIIVVVAPEAVVTPGFQMSFAATLALIGGFDVLNRRRSSLTDQNSVKHPVLTAVSASWRIFLGLAATAIIAGLATSIFSIYHFHRIAPLSLFANVAAMPIVTFVTMPSALIAMVALPFGLDGFVFPVMFSSIDLVIAIADYFASLSSPGRVGAISVARMLLLAVALVLVCLPRTWMRYLFAIPLLIALAPQFNEEPPILHISEDARQVAIVVPATDNRPAQIAVNRNRPNRFTIDQWAEADAVDPAGFIKPKNSQEPSEPNRFHCHEEGVCQARIENGHDPPIRIAVVSDAQATYQQMCNEYELIVESFAPAKLECSSEKAQPVIITAQSLALKGAAQVFMVKAQHSDIRNGVTATKLNVQHAIGDTLRSWHAHRVYSRAARDLAPYQRK